MQLPKGRILATGRWIFDGIHREQLASFNKAGWTGKVVDWAMRIGRFNV